MVSETSSCFPKLPLPQGPEAARVQPVLWFPELRWFLGEVRGGGGAGSEGVSVVSAGGRGRGGVEEVVVKEIHFVPLLCCVLYTVGLVRGAGIFFVGRWVCCFLRLVGFALLCFALYVYVVCGGCRWIDDVMDVKGD